MNPKIEEKLKLLAEVLFFSIPTLVIGALAYLVHHYTNYISMSFVLICIFASATGTLISHYSGKMCIE